MTDTIGRDAADVETAPRRWRGALLWAAVVACVTAAAVVPVVRHAADARDAAWLQRLWAEQAALEQGRAAVFGAALALAGPADGATLGRIAAATDRAEAERLVALGVAAGHRHARLPRARGADRLVAVALTTMAADLREQARDAALWGLVPVIDEILPAATEDRVAAAGRAVSALARAQHLAPLPVHPARFAAVMGDLDALRRVSDRPLDVRLVVSTPDRTQLWDLARGAAHPLATIPALVGFAMPAVAAGVVVDTVGGFVLLPYDGTPARPLPPADLYVGAAGQGLWRVAHGRVRRYDRTLHAVGGWATLPAVGYPIAASADMLALQTPATAPAPRSAATRLWSPETGRVVPLPGVCAADVAAARAAFAYTDCDHRRVMVLDERTGRRTRLRPPAGTTFDPQVAALSPDGRYLATGVVPSRGGGDTDDLRRVAVVDVATGRSQVLPLSTGAKPRAWSPDGSTLVLEQTSALGTSVVFPLSYWQVGAATPHSLRIPGSSAVQAVALP